MDAIGLEALTARLVPRIRAELKQRDDGSLPGERERVAAFDTCNVLLLDYLNELEIAIARAEREANTRAQSAQSEISSRARTELHRHRNDETE